MHHVFGLKLLQYYDKCDDDNDNDNDNDDDDDDDEDHDDDDALTPN